MRLVEGYPVAWILANDGLFLEDYLQKVYLKYELQHKKEPPVAVLLFSDSNWFKSRFFFPYKYHDPGDDHKYSWYKWNQSIHISPPPETNSRTLLNFGLNKTTIEAVNPIHERIKDTDASTRRSLVILKYLIKWKNKSR